MLAVCGDFEIDLTRLDAFLIIMMKNASDSLANEIGCHQFDIAQDQQNPTKVFLYELYGDAISGMVNKKSIRLFKKVNR